MDSAHKIGRRLPRSRRPSGLKWAEETARRMMAEWCPDYEFGWMEDDPRSRHDEAIGDCTYGCTYFRAQRIEIARAHALRDSRAEVLDTIRHEIAHACTGLANHGPDWRWVAEMLGCTDFTFEQ